jgi:hypothetical protein
MKLTEKIAYMKGLLDGMELDGSTKEGKAILQMAEVMEEMGVYIDDLQSQVDELTELGDILDEDLGAVESDLYGDDDEEDDDDDFDDDDDDYPLGKVLPADDDYAFADDDDDDNETQYIVNCPSCGATVTLTEDQLSEGSMDCPCCGETLEFNYDDIETDFSGSDDEEPLDDDSDSGEDQEN